jgi:hypothetical protein
MTQKAAGGRGALDVTSIVLDLQELRQRLTATRRKALDVAAWGDLSEDMVFLLRRLDDNLQRAVGHVTDAGHDIQEVTRVDGFGQAARKAAAAGR